MERLDNMAKSDFATYIVFNENGAIIEIPDSVTKLVGLVSNQAVRITLET